MRNRPDRDPSMLRPHTKPSRTFVGTVEKNRVSYICYKFFASYICYLFKMFFIRNFFQNFIGISSTSTTCNAMYIAGTILQIQITMKFHRQFIYQYHLQSHLHCANDPTLTNIMEFCRPHIHETQGKPHLQCGTDRSMFCL